MGPLSDPGPDRAMALSGTLRFPKGGVAKWRRARRRGVAETVGVFLDRLAQAVADGARFFDVRVDGEEVSLVAWDWRRDWEQALTELVGALEAAGALSPKGRVRVAACDEGRGRWIDCTFVGKKLAVSEGECAPSAARVRAVLEAARPAFDAWLAAHPATHDRHRHRGLFGYLAPNGDEVVPPRLLSATGFHEGVAAVRDRKGHARLLARDGSLSTAGYFLVDECWRGLVPVAVTQDEYGYVDARGVVRIPPGYLAAGPFRGPLAVVRTGVWHTQVERWITPSGVLVGEPFDDTEGFFEERAWVYERTRATWACVAPDGAPAFERRFASAGRFAEGLAAVSEIGAPARFGYVDRDGSTAIAPSFDEAHPFSEGRAVVRIGKAYHLIDPRGQLVGEALGRVPHPAMSEGMLAVAAKGKVGFVDREGAWVIKPRYQEAYGFFEGHAYVRVGDGWGHVDRSGAFTVAPTLQWTHRYTDGLAPAKQGGLFGFIDRSGRWVVPARYTAVQHPFSEGLAWFELP